MAQALSPDPESLRGLGVMDSVAAFRGQSLGRRQLSFEIFCGFVFPSCRAKTLQSATVSPANGITQTVSPDLQEVRLCATRMSKDLFGKPRA